MDEPSNEAQKKTELLKPIEYIPGKSKAIDRLITTCKNLNKKEI